MVFKGYCTKRHIPALTAYKFGESQRLFVAKDTLKSIKRLKMPVLLFFIDGTFGYWDEHKNFYTRATTISYLVSLSANYRIVAIALGQSKKQVKKLVQHLA